MKRLFTLLLISFAALSCEMIDEKIDDQLENKNVVIFAEGTELTANVPSKQTVLNYKFESTLDWEVKTDAEWLEVDPMSGKAGKDIKIQIKVAKNKDKEGRTGYVDLILSNDESYRITINQAGEGDENDENEDVVVEIPNNQIWYTSVDGEIVKPYSGEKNNFADALATFGVNILSNTYVDGKGVIEFDGDVTTIGVWAFYSCGSLASVTIGDSVTTIGDYAFAFCSSLTSVTIPDSVTTIGEAAFSVCSSLQEFNGKFASEDGRCLIIDGVLNSFAPAGLTEYTIPDSVTTIGDYAFYNCSSLTSITIPDSVTTIGGYAFYDCEGLNAVHITDLVTWCNIDFINPLTNGGMDFRANPLVCGKNLYLNGELLTDLIIPDSIKEVKVMTFNGCKSITSVTIPDGVTTIGNAAFWNCSNLTSVTIGDSVTTIGHWAFGSCNSLTGVTIPDSVTEIGTQAFCWCCSLMSINIPNSLTTTGGCVFGCCENLSEFNSQLASEDGRFLVIDGKLVAFAPAGLTEYSIPDSVTSIGDGAFAWCKSLTSVTIPDSITTIEEWAFRYCTSLTSVTIGNGVTTIGHQAFADCYSLTSLYCKPTTPPAGGLDMFDGNASDRKIYVPVESYQDYISADGWGDYAAKIRPYDYENNCVIEANASDETKRWLGKWSSTVSRTYCPQTGFNEETVTFDVNIEHNAVSPHFVKVYGLSVIDPTIAVDGIINANGDLEILNYCYVGNSGGWQLYMWALSETGNLTHNRHPVYTMSMDEGGNVSCKVGSYNSSPYIMFDIFAYNTGNGNISWFDNSLSYYSGSMSWVKVADSGATPSRYSQKVPYITNFRPQADARLKVVE